MADRKAELKNVIIHATHADGTTERESGDSRFAAAQKQAEPVVDINNPANMTRQGRTGNTETDQPIRGGRPKPLKNTDNSKNSPLI